MKFSVLLIHIFLFYKLYFIDFNYIPKFFKNPQKSDTCIIDSSINKLTHKSIDFYLGNTKEDLFIVAVSSNICRDLNNFYQTLEFKNKSFAFSDSLLIIHQLQSNESGPLSSGIFDFRNQTVYYYQYVGTTLKNIKTIKFSEISDRHLEVTKIFDLKMNVYDSRLSIHHSNEYFYIVELHDEMRVRAFHIWPDKVGIVNDYGLPKNFDWAILDVSLLLR